MIMDKSLYIIGDAGKKLVDIESKSIKLIYIDPPYNTGSKFIYNDKRKRQDWIDFMKPKLFESKRVLLDEGVIFISIDDNEYANLQKLCDEIFGEANRLGTLITRQATRSNSKHINTIHEYVICYAKNKKVTKKFETKRTNIPIYGKTIQKLSAAMKSSLKSGGRAAAQEQLKKLLRHYEHIDGYSWLKNYNLVDDDGRIYFAKDLSTPGKPNKLSIPEIGMNLKPLKTRSWTRKETMLKLQKNNEIVYKNNRPYRKSYLVDSKDSLMSILNFYSRQGVHDLDKLGLKGLFDTPKPVAMIKLFILCVCKENDIVLDYFSGSATTGQAVWEVNKEMGLSNKFILIQLEEPLDKNSATSKILTQNGYKNLMSNAGILRLHRVQERIGDFEFEIKR